MHFHELGVFFDLKEMSHKKYAAEVWELFMRQCDPLMMKGSDLFHGEIKGHLPGLGHWYCIVVRTPELTTIQHVKEAFATCSDKRLAPPLDRVRESDLVSKHRLKAKGRVDSDGRLETRKWSRVDHGLCKAAGWAYFPHERPTWLSEAQHRELDAMSEPGAMLAGVSGEMESPSGRRRRSKPKRNFRVGVVLTRAVLFACIVSLVVLAGIGWINRERYIEMYKAKVEEIKIRRILGSEPYARKQEGFSLVNLSKVPPELPLDELNRRLAERGYCVLQCDAPSFVDASMQCSVWFSEDQVGSDVTTQAFISIYMLDDRGDPIWSEQGKGTTRIQLTGDKTANNRHESIVAAINSLDLTDLPDGRSLKHYLREARLGHGRVNLASRRRRELAERRLKGDILKCVSNRWIMCQRLHLTSGSTRDVIVLEEEKSSIWVKTRTGKMMVPADRIDHVEHFDERLFAEELKKVLRSVRKDFSRDWQNQLCDELIAECCKKLVAYGPAYPEASVVSLEPGAQPGQVRAIVRTARGKVEVKKGTEIDGFKVVGIDSETCTVLLKKGNGGEVLRIWPEPTAEES